MSGNEFLHNTRSNITKDNVNQKKLMTRIFSVMRRRLTGVLFKQKISWSSLMRSRCS